MKQDFLHLPWHSLGTVVKIGSPDDALGVAERLWSINKDLANVVVWDEISPAIKVAEFRFKLTTENADVDIDVWARRKGSDELVRVCTLDIIAGTQVAADGKLFADSSVTIANEQWPETLVAKVGAAEHCLLLNIPLCGYDGLLFHGYGTCDESCIVEASGWAN